MRAEVRTSTGHARTQLLVILGVLALSAATVLAVKLATRRTEVDQLFEILCGGDTADAAWAFEKLKEVGDESLPDFLPHLWNERPTLLHDLHYARASAGASTGRRAECFQVSQVARFVLVCRTGRIADLRDWELDRPRRDGAAWKTDIERVLSTRARPNGASYPGKRRFLESPKVRPPSRDPRLSTLAWSGDVDGLMETIKSGSKAEAQWAFEVLRSLPDETIEKLLPLAANQERTGLCYLPSSSFSVSVDVGYRVGALAFCLLWSRAGGSETDLWKAITDPKQGAPQNLSAFWKDYRKRKQKS